MPTVVIGDNSGDDYSGTEDAPLLSSSPVNNYGAAIDQELTTRCPYLLKFSGLSSITGPVSVSSAIVSIYKVSGTGTGTVTMRRVLRDWIEGTLNDADRQNDDPDSCCYNEYGSGNSWTTAGCGGDGTDRVADAAATMDIDATAGQYYDSSSMHSTIEGFINSSYSNYGVICHSSAGGWTIYTAMSERTDGERPYLTVEYTTGGGTAHQATIQDSVDVADILSRSIGRRRTIEDEAGITDLLSVVSDKIRSITDTASISDTLSRAMQTVRSISDTVHITDVLSRVVQFIRSIADSTGITDAVTRIQGHIRALADTEGITDLTTAQVFTLIIRSISDSVGITDTISRTTSMIRLVYNSVSISDTLSRIGSFFRSVSNTVGISDTLTRIGRLIRSITDALGITDSVSSDSSNRTYPSYITAEVVMVSKYTAEIINEATYTAEIINEATYTAEIKKQ